MPEEGFANETGIFLVISLKYLLETKNFLQITFLLVCLCVTYQIGNLIGGIGEV